MESTNTEIVHEFFPFFKVYKDGRVERFMPMERIPPYDDSHLGVRSKDVQILSQPLVSARIFMPSKFDLNKKLPLLVYIHGGGFSIGSAFYPGYHKYVASLVAKAGVIAVSVEYRLAPEHLMPACYDDSWAALQWVASHANGDGPDPWLNNHADLNRVFLAGDSAGANISHNMMVRVGSSGLPGVKIVGMALVHPFFSNNKPDKLLEYIFPSCSGCNDPRLNPAAGSGSELAGLGCTRVLVCVAEKDWLKDRGLSYYEALKKSGWGGVVEFVESEGEDHVFHLFKPDCDKAMDLLEKVVSFMIQD